MLHNRIATQHPNRLICGFAFCVALALPAFGLAQTLFQGPIPMNLGAAPTFSISGPGIAANGSPFGSCAGCVNIGAPPVLVLPAGGQYDMTVNGPSFHDFGLPFSQPPGTILDEEFGYSTGDPITLSAAGGTLITGFASYLDIYAQLGSPGAVYQFTLGGATSQLYPGLPRLVYVILNGATSSAVT